MPGHHPMPLAACTTGRLQCPLTTAPERCDAGDCAAGVGCTYKVRKEVKLLHVLGTVPERLFLESSLQSLARQAMM
jgi:hypothetical protein